MTATEQLEQELDLLTTELVEVQDQLLALYELARVLGGHLEPESLLSALVAEAVRLGRASGGFALLGQVDEAPLLVVSPGLPLDSAMALELGRRLSGTEPVVHGIPGVGRVMLVPIPLREARSAVLGLVREPSRGGFDMPEQKLITAVAAHAGSHLEGVLRHQETMRMTRLDLEFELARTVQAGLSPSVPGDHPGLDIYAESRAAYVIGGDFFDFTVGDDGRLVIVLGDVAGKGIPAALLVAMTRASIRAAAREVRGDETATVLARANGDLYRDFSQLGLFATVFLASYEPAGRRVVVANAGHSPVIYRPAGGAPRLVRAEAPPIGVVLDWQPSEVALRLEPGDLLVAATDGFSEAEDARTGELYGYDRVLALVEQTADRTAAEVAGTFYDVTDAFSAGAGPSDDRTVLVMRGIP